MSDPKKQRFRRSKPRAGEARSGDPQAALHAELARRLGLRGHSRLARRFNEEVCVDGYRELLYGAATPHPVTADAGHGLVAA